MSALEFFSKPDVVLVVELACRLHGHKRGFAVAADALGVSARTARGIAYGEATGATIPEDRVEDALHTLRRARAAQLRAELAALEEPMPHAVLESSRAPVRVVR
ncbi:MAG TPA: hypothetical protein VGN96_03880 [Roseococcus sp.]|jgi:hypothetical protein|nr:hypothetical protein [Roseococcus sp.]